MRIVLVLLIAMAAGACELVGDIFQVGFIGGVLVAVVLVALVAWLVRKFRGGRTPN